jgi:serine/threonine-protein kinase
MQGKASLEAGDFARACPKLQESYGLDPATGTLLALAVCHAAVGLSATAWRELRSAAEGATKEGRADRVQFARDQIARLEPKLSRLTLVVPPDAPAGTSVELDGAPVARADWGKASPVDPGHHILGARAPGRTAWSATVDVGSEHDAQTVTVGPLLLESAHDVAPTTVSAPPLAPAPPPPEPSSIESASVAPVDASSSPGSWKRPAGLVAAGVGVVALGVGTYFGVSAISKSSDAKGRCTPSSCTDAGAVRENDDAKTAATVADVTIVAGIAALGAGAFLFFTAPAGAPRTTALRVAPLVGRERVGLALEQAF